MKIHGNIECLVSVLGSLENISFEKIKVFQLFSYLLSSIGKKKESNFKASNFSSYLETV